MRIAERCPAPILSAGDESHAFRILRVEPVPEIRMTAYLAEHVATGAQVLHLHCDDRENTYVVTFKTPPSDSTGVAHILEHSVLAGSETYPVKDAFNELSRGSLATFVNAFTGDDFTAYPVSSQVPQDFYNLVSVYTDLVFRPRLSRNTFLQEGHHLEIGDDGELRITGVVYNEMKGSFSTAERVSSAVTTQELLPDTPYGVESGGHPQHIPDLTYEAFIDFHRRFYAPSNARIFFYGDLPTPDHLAFLGPRLDQLERRATDADIPDQPRWTAPRQISARFPADPMERVAGKTTVNVAWLTAPAADLDERLILEILDEVLIGSASAPLRKALIESGLGQDLSPVSGLHPWMKEMPFIVGLRGADTDQARAIEELAVTTLQRITEEGIPRDLLEAAFHQVEFHGLEIRRGGSPFGITLMMRTLSSWLHADDPFPGLSFPARARELRKRWEEEPRLFETAARRWLVDNPHRLRALIEPDPTLAAESEARVRSRLAGVKAAMTPEEVEEVRKTADALRAAQRQPDPPEILATLPRLQRSEIPREIETVHTETIVLSGVEGLEHDLFTNGIVHVDATFDVSDVPADLQPYLPLLGATASGMGAGGLDYEALTTRKALVTGGVGVEPEVWPRLDGGQPIERLVVHGRALARNTEPMVDILRDIIVDGDLTDVGRMRDILSEARNRLRARVAPAGHVFVQRLAASGLIASTARQEQWRGLDQLRLLADTADDFEARTEQLQEILEALRRHVFRRDRMTVNLTADDAGRDGLRDAVRTLIQAVPSGSPPGRPPSPALGRADVGVAIPGEVCYVGRATPIGSYDDPDAAALTILGAHLASEYIYQRVRVEGGAYGAFASFDAVRGVFTFSSYRDPNLEETLAAFDTAIDRFLERGVDQERLRKAVLGTIGRLDAPRGPYARGYAEMRRRFMGLTDERRRRYRDGLLAVEANDLMRAAERLRSVGPEAVKAVLAPRERIERANAQLPSAFIIRGLES